MIDWCRTMGLPRYLDFLLGVSGQTDTPSRQGSGKRTCAALHLRLGVEQRYIHDDNGLGVFLGVDDGAGQLGYLERSVTAQRV